MTLRLTQWLGLCACAAASLVVGAADALAQRYPTKPIRIVTSGTGGTSDFAARLTAPALSEAFRQPVIIENRTTFGSAEIVARATPDGQTLLVAGTPLLTEPLLRTTTFNAVSDFSPITFLMSVPLLVVVHPSLPVKSVKELIGYAQARPGVLNYAISGTGGANHLAGELFKDMAGTNIVNVPYASSGQAVSGVISGETQLMFSTGPSVSPQVKAGRLRALAVTSAEPSILFPGLPTVAASLPGYEMVSLTFIADPASTSKAIIQQLNKEYVRILNTPDIKEKFINSGAEVVGNSPEQSAAIIKASVARLSALIKSAGIRVN